jgi:hypothetical protein
MDIVDHDNTSATVAAGAVWRLVGQVTGRPLIGSWLVTQALLGYGVQPVGASPVSHSTSAATADWRQYIRTAVDVTDNRPQAAVTTMAAIPQTYIGPSLQQLDELSTLEDDWNYYGAAAPTPVAISLARRFLEQTQTQVGAIARDRVRPFHIAPVPGGVQLEWVSKDGELNLVIGPTGEMSFLQVNAGADGRNYGEQHNVTWSDAMRQVARNVLPHTIA